ncbi:hypothetical protein EMIT0P260_10356 [Pseudomonas sp. IT-P260]
MVRGFIPDRLRSSREVILRGVSGLWGVLHQGPLRDPSGINPLTTRLTPARDRGASGVFVPGMKKPAATAGFFSKQVTRLR